MDKKIIVGVEGISYAGKTTLCNEIESKYSNLYKIIYESPKFANVKIKITDKIDEIIDNSQKTLVIEELRSKCVIESDDLLYLYDRTIFSFISISYAYYKTGIVDYFNNYLDAIIEGINKGVFLVPDYLVYLDIDEKELLNRKKIKMKSLPDYWTSNLFNESINFILRKIVNLYKENNRILQKDEICMVNYEKMSKVDYSKVINVLKEMKI